MANIIFEFSGEESARFSRFALACIDQKIKPLVQVIGREPLTNRPIRISGLLHGATLDGYLRYIEVCESQSGIVYWVAGSNSTRSIATKLLSFEVDNSGFDLLKQYGEESPLPVPGIERKNDEIDEILWSIEGCIKKKNNDNLSFLLKCIEHSDERVQLESALTLRTFSSFVVDSTKRQVITEKSIVHALPGISNWETRAALVEDLGYFGQDPALSCLKEILQNKNEHDHVRWAASIAIGRLPGVDAVSCLQPGLSSNHEWTKAATLLSMARQASETQKDKLEPIFHNFLGASQSSLMTRYAALGLSKFSSLSEKSVNSLSAILGDGLLDITVRGYAALALSSSLSNINSTNIEQLRQILGRFSRAQVIDMSEPEAIWGVEYLAQLASLLEQNEVSTILHGLLADHFDDWRSAYYKCMQYYERGESQVRRGVGDDAILSYQHALSYLPSSEKLSIGMDLPSEAKATIEFRRDMVTSRLQLQSLIGGWLSAIGTKDLNSLIEGGEKIRETYKRYSISTPYLGPDRQLVDREIAYIKNTADLVAVIKMLIELDSSVSDPSTLETDLQRIIMSVHIVTEHIEKLQKSFRDSFSQSLQKLIENTLSYLKNIESGLLSKDLDLPDKLRFARTAMTQIRSVFWRASWPMPARACPLYGLGRASLTIRTEGIRGTGSQDEPYIFPENSPPALLVSVRIFEMAPGGATNLELRYKIGKRINNINIPIVEDQYVCSIHLEEPVPTYTPVSLEFSLVFKASDCTQQAENKVVYLISEKPS